MSKNYYILCLFCCVFCACQPSVEKQTETPVLSEKQDSIVLKPAIELDTTYTELPQPEPIDSHNFYYQPNKNSKQLKRFLTEPIDLPRFKKKNGANSRVSERKDYYLKPKEKGFYYNYFLFRGCYERGLVIDVYMYGDSPGSYSKANETLVDLKCRCKLRDLKDLDLVGKEWETIKEKYGDNYLKVGDKRVYAYKGNLIIIELGRKNISSYRYVRTNLRQIKSVDDIPETLLR
ncbi:MAG: hypothetical protein JKY03_09150 [Aureispira sp.]|nr:hypothetical protein [Aureispira sp.]